jgi:hypothetical protein
MPAGQDDILVALEKDMAEVAQVCVVIFLHALLAVVYVSHVMRIDFLTTFVCN